MTGYEVRVGTAVVYKGREVEEINAYFLSCLSRRSKLLGSTSIIGGSSSLVRAAFNVFGCVRSPGGLGNIAALMLRLPIVLSFTNVSGSGECGIGRRLYEAEVGSVAL